MYADLHCHPVSWSYNQLVQTEEESDPEAFHPWNIPESDEKSAAKGKRAFDYSQCDLSRLSDSCTRLVFASLYPMEKGFFDEKIIGSGQRLDDKHTLLDYIQSKKMNLSLDRVAFFQSPEYEYFEELKKEYAYYLGSNERVADNNWKYRLAGTKEDIVEGLGAEQEIVIVLTIEGAHALGLGNPDGKGEDVSMATVKERIRSLKGEGDDAWAHPVFFITFAHHFDNTLCGHAHSFPAISNIVFDQSENMNEGVFEKGHEVMLELLGLKRDLTDDNSRRVLIDVKHMSAKARRDYYDRIIKPRNRRQELEKIPVIASHMGYAGAKTLDELIRDMDREKDNFKKNNFYAWNINLCDEDIHIIHESEGLIGLSFDQRILGTDTVWGPLSFSRRNNMTSFIRMIDRIVSVPHIQRLPDPLSIWSRICIGTDFEGYINPIDKYSTAESFPDFEADLTNALNKLRKRRPKLFGHLDTGDIVRNICFNNAHSFVLKHFK